MRKSDTKLIIALFIISAACFAYAGIFFELNPSLTNEPVPQQLVVLLGLAFFVGFFLFLTRPPKEYTEEEQEPDKPLFTISNIAGIGLFTIVGGIFLLGLIDTIYQGIIGTESTVAIVSGGLFEGAISAASFYYAYLGVIMPARVVEFYDDSLTISGWRTNLRASYWEISTVELQSNSKRFSNTSRIKVSIQGQTNLFVFSNVKLRKLKTNAYAWLAKKVQQARTKPPI